MANPKSLLPPFFILGCVRSGTTLLRDLLRNNPRFACAEETHFFRWGDPFATPKFIGLLRSNPVLQAHRRLDGISEAEFEQMLLATTSRSELQHRYMTEFVRRNKPTAQRWFDKTPQNVYGALLIATTMPFAKFVHIVRDPVNVAASLRLGRVMQVERIVGAVNYWNEAVNIISGLKIAYPDRVHELRYEDLMQSPEHQLQELLAFLKEPAELGWLKVRELQGSDHRAESVLNDSEIRRIEQLCTPGMKRYGYLS